MIEVTNQMWQNAINRLKKIKRSAKISAKKALTHKSMAEVRLSYVNEFQERYNNGERSIKLYNGIMDL